MSWTDERIELLRKLWLDGLSASKIAGELAEGLTRNAVIGKVYRLGLSGRTKAAAVPETAPRARAKAMPRARISAPASPPIASQPIVHGNTALALSPCRIEVPAQIVTEDVVIAIAEPVTIVELRESMCRWPIGDPASPDFRFCGAGRRLGAGPYCPHHSRIAYQPQQERRREKMLQKPA